LDSPLGIIGLGLAISDSPFWKLGFAFWAGGFLFWILDLDFEFGI
jgi:hypothetical protein